MAKVRREIWIGAGVAGLAAAVAIAGPFLIVRVDAPKDGVLRYLSWEGRQPVRLKGRHSVHISFKRYGRGPDGADFRLRCVQPGWPVASAAAPAVAYGYAGFARVVIDGCDIKGAT